MQVVVDRVQEEISMPAHMDIKFIYEEMEKSLKTLSESSLHIGDEKAESITLTNAAQLLRDMETLEIADSYKAYGEIKERFSNSCELDMQYNDAAGLPYNEKCWEILNGIL